MLTIFGKKKKEDEKKDAPPGNIQQAPQQPSQPNASDHDTSNPDESPFAKIFQSISQEYQNTTPPNRPESVGAPPLSVTPDWVQPRQLPRSTPMVITPPGARNSQKSASEEGWEERKAGTNAQPEAQFSSQLSSPSQPVPSQENIVEKPSDISTPPKSTSPASPLKAQGNPSGSMKTTAEIPAEPSSLESDKKTKKDDSGNSRGSGSSTFTEGVSSFDSSGEFSLSGFEDLSKLLAETDTVLAQGRQKEMELAQEKPVAVQKEKAPTENTGEAEKPPKKPSENKLESPSGTIRGFEHISELTQGSLDTPGTVVIDGPTDSGKTTLCLGLVDRYLKQGSPCIFVTFNQAPSTVRDELKKLGCDIGQYESNYRFMMIDAYTAQSGGFSMELYSLMDPWDIQRFQESIVDNCTVFMGEKVRVIIDSLDGLVSRNQGKDFEESFGQVVAKLKETGATVIASIDLSKAGKDVKGWAEDETDCLIEVDVEKAKDGTEHSLGVSRLKGSKVKGDAEEWDIEPGKGLVFV